MNGFDAGPSIRGTNVAFGAGLGVSSGEGIFIGNQVLEKVVQTGDSIPGGGGTQFGILESPVYDGKSVAFQGSTVGGPSGNYFASPTSSFSLSVVADINTNIPEGTGQFLGVALGFPALDAANVAFVGSGTGGQQGIYTNIGGALRKVIATGDALNGKEVVGLGLGQQGLSENEIVFVVDFPGTGAGGSGIYVASPSHFMCYKAKESRGNICSDIAAANVGDSCGTDAACGGIPGSCIRNRFPRGVQVSLDEQFEDEKDFDIKKPKSICTPPEASEEIHLKGYEIKEARGEPRHIKRRNVRVDNLLGRIFVDTIKPDRLLVPSAKDLTNPVSAPTDPDVDHYECFKVRVKKNVCEDNPSKTCTTDADCTTGICNLGFPKGIQIRNFDQFNTPRGKLYNVQKPTRLCNPVAKTFPPGGTVEPIQDQDTHLMCYTVRPAKGEPRHRKRIGIHVNNQIGPERLDTKKEEEACFLSSKTT